MFFYYENACNHILSTHERNNMENILIETVNLWYNNLSQIAFFVIPNMSTLIDE